MVCSVSSERFEFLVDQWTHTVWHMLLMSPVDSHTFLAVAVITAGFLAGAVIFLPILPAECGGEFFLKS